MIGSPGTGKTMLARRLPTILPPLTPDESLETTRIYTAMGRLRAGRTAARRRGRSAPRTTPSATPAWSAAARIPQPGEISLAHHGVLFLDELPEFNRRSLEVLRQPLEEGRVTISRAVALDDVPRRLRAGRRDEPVPVRLPGRPEARRASAPRSQIEKYMGRISRAAAGPHRPAHRGAAGAVRGAVEPGRRHRQRRDARAGRSRRARSRRSASAKARAG